jgi:hypothetical protein
MRDLPVVFILGCGHSGSTILELLLNAHSDMVCTGEVEKVGVKTREEQERCSCGEKFDTCPFWGEYMATRSTNSFFTRNVWQLAQSKKDFLLNRPVYTPLRRVNRGIPFKTDEFDLDEYVRDTEDLFAYILEKSGEGIVVDSSKNTARANALERYSKRIRPYYIHIVRDGRGVTWSYAKKYNRYGKYMARWFLENLKAEVLRWKTDAPLLRVSYRKLIKNPEAELRRICAFLGVGYEPQMLQYADAAHHTVGGNAGAIKSNIIREDTGWKEAMPYRYQLLFNSLFGIANALFLWIAEKSDT